jgi:hypothetical protein
MASQMPRCSFCGKSRDSVRRLIAGPGVYICDRCVDLCVDVLDGGGRGPSRTARLSEPPLRRLARRLSCVFRRFSGGGAPA